MSKESGIQATIKEYKEALLKLSIIRKRLAREVLAERISGKSYRQIAKLFSGKVKVHPQTMKNFIVAIEKGKYE